jgi:hypothetical protein
MIQLLRPGCDIFSDPEVMAQIRSFVIVFRPNVWPQLVNWTTFPMRTALLNIWAAFRHHEITKPNDPVPWQWVEMANFFERLLSFAHTGQQKFLPTKLLNVLGLASSIKDRGYPTLTRAVDMRNGIPTVTVATWPVADGKPILGATSAIEYHWNDSIANVRTLPLSEPARWPGGHLSDAGKQAGRAPRHLI